MLSQGACKPASIPSARATCGRRVPVVSCKAARKQNPVVAPLVMSGLALILVRIWTVHRTSHHYRYFRPLLHSMLSFKWSFLVVSLEYMAISL
jgi:hypothetical protein